jgi:hypothetical protein
VPPLRAAVPPLRAAALLWLALACASPPPAPRESGLLFLWEVAGADGTAAGHAFLLGSLHFGTGRTRWDPAIRSAFDGAETLVQEVAPDAVSPERMVELLLAHGRLPEGRTLRDVLPAPTWAALEARLEGDPVRIAAALPFEPWVVMLQLVVERLAAQGFTPEQGVDARFLAEAGERPVLGLETPETQLRALDAMTLAFQIHALEGVLGLGADGSGGPLDAPSVDEIWRLGDAEALERFAFAGLGEDPGLDAFYEAVYFERNRRMSARIAELVGAGGRYFVTIGAGHLVGARGIPALLEAQGLRVRRVPRTVPP